MFSRQELAALIEQYITSLPLPAEPNELYAPISYSLDTGGKRVRPLLLLAGCNLFSDDLEPAMTAAAAVEVFHNFTLLHDDIMDNADIRRGRAAVHKKWSTNTAILSGDTMMIYAYGLIAKTRIDNILPILDQFNAMALEVCEGQQWDMDFELMKEVYISDYIRMIELKTAALIARPLRIGAMIAGAKEADCQALYNFGVALGTAFQLQDDLLDTYGTTGSLGKSVGGDIIEEKKTFLLITALSNAEDEAKDQLNELLADITVDHKAKIALVTAIYDRLQIRQITERAIVYHTNLAIDSLDRVAVESEKKSLLKQLALGLINREK